MRLHHALLLAASLALPCPALSDDIYFVESPVPCNTLERFEEGKVFLTTPQVFCGKFRGRVKIDGFVPPEREVEIYVDGESWEKQRVQKLDVSSIASLTVNTEALDIGNNSLAPKPEPQVSDLTTGVMNVLQSRPYQDYIAAESDRLASEFLGISLDELRQRTNQLRMDTPKDGIIPRTDRIFVFISKSVPLPILRAYVRSLDLLRDPNAVFVMRGLVGGLADLKPMREFVESIVKVDPTCSESLDASAPCPRYAAEVLVDPLLFERFGITVVPSFVYASDVRKTASVTPGEGKSDGLTETDIGSFYGISGDMSLDGALEEINLDAESQCLEVVVEKLRQGFYQK